MRSHNEKLLQQQRQYNMTTNGRVLNVFFGQKHQSPSSSYCSSASNSSAEQNASVQVAEIKIIQRKQSDIGDHRTTVSSAEIRWVVGMAQPGVLPLLSSVDIVSATSQRQNRNSNSLQNNPDRPSHHPSVQFSIAIFSDAAAAVLNPVLRTNERVNRQTIAQQIILL